MRRRKNVFWTLWLSYLLILLIPVTISVFLYSNIKSTMVENANRSNLAMLEQVRQVVDGQMQDIDRLTIQIASHPKLQALWNLNDGERYLEYSEAVAALKTLRFGTGLIGEFYIHYRNRDMILSPTLKTDTQTYFDKISPYGGYTAEEVKEKLLTGYHFKTFWPSESAVSSTMSQRNVIATATTLPLGEINNVRATLVMLIEEQHIFALLKQIEWANSASMYIVDESGRVILSTTGQRALPDGLPTGAPASGYLSFQHSGQDMMLSYTHGVNGWKYISLIPKEVVLQRINEITNWVVTMLIVVLLIGTAAAYWMAYRSYGPIRDMVSALLSGNAERSPPVSNEYEFIKSSIARNLAEREEMMHRLADHAPVVRAHFLTRLLNGQTEPSQIEQSSIDFMGLHLPHKLNCVVLVTCDDSSEFRREDSEEEWALVRFVLVNLSSGLIDGNGYVVETERNQLALLLNLADSEEEARRLRDGMIADLKEITTERFRMQISIASSSIHPGIQGFERGYREALSALDYRIIHGVGSIIYYDQTKEIKDGYYQYPLEAEIRLANFLKGGESEQAERLLDELYELNVVSGELTSEMGKFLAIDLLSTVIKVLNALKLDGKELLQGIDPIRYIMDNTSVQEMLQKTKELCRLICSNVNGARTDQGDLLNERIKRYIGERVLDNNLSLTSIADHFGMAPQYISGFFKKQNRVNLNEFIVDSRMQVAKKLLAETNLTMMQIAQHIGYANDIGFIRVFKKLEGITPGKYREMIRGAESKNA
ncbi:AraC family transcriptional regulator [Paenibacillus sp.]|uniref:AraC family transcriptional regulator n=1 Tax=Paenibacillus sp. TaxID=58172 RepID=UPI002811CA58|nr:AraC family transcriptional regulator [Paenibacillus sp.]